MHEKPRLPRTLGHLRAWLRDTEIGREIVREIAAGFLQEKCSKCKRNPSKLVDLEILDEMPPCDDDLEQRMIGMMIVEPKTIDVVSGIVQPEDFHDFRAEGIYRAILELRAKDAVDVSLLIDHLRETGQLYELDAPAYCYEAFIEFWLPSHAKHYAKIILDHATRRRLIGAAVDMLVGAYAMDQPVCELIEKMFRTLKELKTL